VRKYSGYLLLGLIVLFYFAGNSLWMKMQHNDYVLCFDDAVHFSAALDAYDNLQQHRFARNYNAPLPPYITAVLLFLFGKQQVANVILVANLLYLALALLLTWKIGEYIADRQTGLLAAVLLSLYPAMYGLSRLYGQGEYAVIVAAAFNIYCLLRSRRFTDLKWSLLYGVSVGIGLLTKDTFIAFFAGPLLYIAASALKEKRELTVYANIVAALFIGAIMAMPHYARKEILAKVAHELISENTGPWYRFENLKIFTIGLSDELLSPPFFLAFLFGLWHFLQNYKKRDEKAALLLWFLVPWLVLVFMPHRKMTEYSVPYLPAIALMSAAGLSSVKTAFRKYIFCALAVLALVQYADFSYGAGPGLYKRQLRIKLRGHYDKILYYYHLNEDILYYKDNRQEPYDRVVKALEKKMVQRPGKHEILVALEKNVPMLYPFVLQDIGRLRSLPFVRITDTVFAPNDMLTPDQFDSIDMVLYSGVNEFGSPEYLAYQYESTLNITEGHPAMKEEVLEHLNRIDRKRYEEQFSLFARRLAHREYIGTVGKNAIYLYTKD